MVKYKCVWAMSLVLVGASWLLLGEIYEINTLLTHRVIGGAY